MVKFSRFILSGLVLCCVALSAQAAFIERTITLDGDMSDWYDVPPTYTPSGDITNNVGQFSNDGEDGGALDDLDEPIGSTGRDLKKFSFTWDNTYLYFYVERWASSTNVTDWWFYIDGDVDGLMEAGEKVVRVNWQGANRRTDVEIWDYVENIPGGDDITGGDGSTMPGGIINQTVIYTGVVTGATTGTEMESRVTWASLGFPGGPANIAFHISSSNGTNIPTQIKDNMDGPAGGQLFPVDLQVSKTASVASILGNQPFTYTVTVFNAAIVDFTNVVISDVIPATTTYVSHSAEAGTTFDDSDANTIPDEWNIPTIAANATYTLTINVTAGVVPVTMIATNTATLTASDQTDEDATNDSASVNVSIEPVPVLTMLKYTASPTVNPGSNISYTIQITNTGGANGNAVVVTDALSPFSMLRVNTYGALTPFQLTEGTPASGITLGTTTYSDDNGATYTYVPSSGGGGAPAGYDANVTNWNIDMVGTMASSNSNFDIQYQVQTR